MPDTAEAYIHRTGRTGRASLTGEALTFATSEDSRMIRVIEHVLDEKMRRQTADATPFPRQATVGVRTETTRPGTVNASHKVARGSTENRSSRRNRPVVSGVFGLSGRNK
jgi:superfamily II DNA/RNA helicase